MAPATESKTEATVPAPKAKEVIKNNDSIEFEDRIDEFGVSAFQALGYTGRLPDALVSAYKEFKRRKDLLHPGRLSPEGFAFVDMIAAMAEGTLKLGK